MGKKSLIKLTVALFALGFVSCSSVHQNRAVSSIEIDSFGNRDFLTEYKNTSKIPLKGLKERLTLIFDWVRNNPIAMNEQLRAKQPNFVFAEIPKIKKHVRGWNKSFTSKVRRKTKGAKKTVMVTKYKDVTEVLNNPKKFSVRLYRWKMDKSANHPFMLAYDDTRYNNREKPWMRSMLHPDDLPKIKQVVSQLTKDAIEKHTVNGRIDIVNSVARKVPLQLTGKYFGFPGPDLPTMYRWSRAMQDDFFHNAVNDGTVEKRADVAGAEIQAYLGTMLKDKRKKLAEMKASGEIQFQANGHLTRASYDKLDVASRLIATNVTDSDLMKFWDDDRITTNILGFLVGGVETTQAAVAQSLDILMKDKNILAGARQAAKSDDDALLMRYVWEALRFKPVNPFVIRFAEADHTFSDGTKIKKGTVLFVGTHSAMFDEEVVKDPNSFRLDRPFQTSAERYREIMQKRKRGEQVSEHDEGDTTNPKNIYFHIGYGHHRCLGDYIAEVQVTEIVKQILLQDNLRRSTGAMGQISQEANWRYTSTDGREDQAYHERSKNSFPERMVVEYDYQNKASTDVVGDPRWSFEDYIGDYDRKEFRQCLSGGEHDKFVKIVRNVFRNIKTQKRYTHRFGLFWCRLPRDYRECYGNLRGNDYMSNRKNILLPRWLTSFFKLKNEQKRYNQEVGKYEACKSHLDDVQNFFYQSEILKQPEVLSNAPRATVYKGRDHRQYEFEKYVRFYDRERYRDTFLNPVSVISFKYERDIMFYARLEIEVRKCIAKKVKIKRMSREKAFGICADKKGFELDDFERKYYQRYILGQQ